jgi:hypothetical protein
MPTDTLLPLPILPSDDTYANYWQVPPWAVGDPPDPGDTFQVPAWGNEPVQAASDDGFPLDSDLNAMTDDGGPLDPYPARHEHLRPVFDRPAGDPPVEDDRWQDRYQLDNLGDKDT